jgi:phage gp36-like protein
MASLKDALDEAFASPEDTAPEPVEPDEEVVAQETQEESAVEEAVEEAAAEEEVLLAGKYKDPAELEKAYNELQSKLGQQGEELGKLRQLEEQITALQQAQDQPTMPNPFEQPAWDTIDFDNPAQARNAALWIAQNQPFNYEPFMDAWFEQASNPRAASNFQLEMKQYEWEQNLEERLAPLTPIPQRMEADDKAAQVTATFEKVWADLNAQNPDLNDYAEKIIEEARSAPALAGVFQNGDAEQMQHTLTVLLNAARYRRTAAEAIAQQSETDAAETAKSKASLTRASASVGSQTAKPKNPIHALWDKEVLGLDS